MSHYFEFTGSSVEEAVENATRELQVSRKEFRYKIISDPNSQDKEILIRVFLGNDAKEKKPYTNHRNHNSYQREKKPFRKERDFYNMEESEAEQFSHIDTLEQQEVQVQKILLFLKGMFSYLEIELEGFLLEEREEEIYINLKCNEPAILIGKQGAVLNSIQFLVGAYVPKVLKEMGALDEFKKSFTIDIQGYRNKRLKRLKEDVYQVVQRLKQPGEGILLEGEFSPIERRQIHVYAQSLPGIITESQGTGFLKSVLIKSAE